MKRKWVSIFGLACSYMLETSFAAAQGPALPMCDYPRLQHSAVAVDEGGGIYFGHLRQWGRVETAPSPPATIWSRSSDGGVVLALQNGDVFQIGSPALPVGDLTLTYDSNVFSGSASGDVVVGMTNYPRQPYSAVAMDEAGGIYFGRLSQWSRVGTAPSAPAAIWSRASGGVIVALKNGDVYGLGSEALPAGDWTLTYDSNVFSGPTTGNVLLSMADYPRLQYAAVALDEAGGIYFGHLQQWSRIGTTPGIPAMIWSRSSDGGVFIVLANGDLYQLGSPALPVGNWRLTYDSNVFGGPTSAEHSTLGSLKARYR